jgi:hypothetical protein
MDDGPQVAAGLSSVHTYDKLGLGGAGAYGKYPLCTVVDSCTCETEYLRTKGAIGPGEIGMGDIDVGRELINIFWIGHLKFTGIRRATFERDVWNIIVLRGTPEKNAIFLRLTQVTIHPFGGCVVACSGPTREL